MNKMIRKLVLSMFLSGAVGMPFVGSALADEPTVASPENGIAAQGEGIEITVADVLQHMSKTLGDNVVAQLKAKSPKDFAFAFTLYRDQLVALALLKNAALKKSDELMKLPEVKEAVTKMKEQILNVL